MELYVDLIDSTPTSTLSKLSILDNDYKCFIIEDTIRDEKIKHETAIPAGRYQIVRRVNSRFLIGSTGYAIKFKHLFVPELVGIPNYTSILIHIGNTKDDTSGCLLPNLGATLERDTWIGSKSTAAYLPLYEIISAAYKKKEEVWITINRTLPEKIVLSGDNGHIQAG